MKRIAALLLAPVALCGCHRLLHRPIPDFDTAREQYRYAQDLVEQTDPLPEEHRETAFHTGLPSPYFEPAATRYRNRDYRRFIDAFGHVVQRFPDDTEFTPNSRVRIAEFYAQLEEYGLAASGFREVLDSYPDDEVLQAAALFGLGKIAMARRQFSEAQRYYQEIIQRYHATTNPAITDLVERSQMRLQQLQYQFSR